MSLEHYLKIQHDNKLESVTEVILKTFELQATCNVTEGVALAMTRSYYARQRALGEYRANGYTNNN